MADERVMREIVRETREEVVDLPLDRLDRPEKRAAEAKTIDGASRVEFAERDWRKRRPESLQEIQRIVDAMGTPREERLRVGDRVFLPPEEALPPTRALTDVERRAIEGHLGAKVVRASIIYRSSRGHVVEVETDREGARAVTLLSVLGEKVRDLRGIQERVDEFQPRGWAPPTPEEPAPSAPVAEAPAPSPVPAEPPAPTTYTVVEAAPEAPVAEAPAPPPAEEPKKRRFGLPKLPKLGKKAEAPAEGSAAPAPAPEPAPAQESPAKEKRRFGLPKLRKKKE